MAAPVPTPTPTSSAPAVSGQTLSPTVRVTASPTVPIECHSLEFHDLYGDGWGSPLYLQIDAEGSAPAGYVPNTGTNALNLESVLGYPTCSRDCVYSSTQWCAPVNQCYMFKVTEGESNVTDTSSFAVLLTTTLSLSRCRRMGV